MSYNVEDYTISDREVQEGELVLLDNKFNNKSIVKLIHKGTMFGRVQASDGYTWDTSLYRLDAIDLKNK